ncbi:alpha/beta hydrolase [Burkholderia cepacia]|nr:alpha/beta hydrolase [Burkholderia cepacia]
MRRFAMKSLLITSGRAMLATEVFGSGEPIVFLHARVADRRMWGQQIREIGVGNQAIAYDRRGFGETVAEAEDHSAVEDLIAVLQSVAGGSPAILVACSQGGGIALDAALRYPSYVRGLVLVAPSVTGAPKMTHAARVEDLITRLAAAEARKDIEEVVAIRATLWLDGPFQPEGRVAGEARKLFDEMNVAVLGLPPTGTNTDAPVAYGRLRELLVPTLVMCGDLDLPGIQERSRYVAANVSRGTFHQISGTAHLPSLERPQEVTSVIASFINQCKALQ